MLQQIKAPANPAQGGKEGRLKSLDPLRGIGALIVMIYHAINAGFGGPGAGKLLMPYRGYLAVDMFFILSGFVLAYVYGADFLHELKPKRYATFMWARFARLYPLHLFTILLFLRFYGQTGYSGQALALNFLLVQGPWLSHPSWNQPSWSISAEWHAYFLFPFLCAFLWRIQIKTAIAVAGGCVLMLVLICAESHQWSVASITAGPLILARALPEFVTGILAFRVYNSGWLHAFWRLDRVFVAIAVAIFALSAIWPTDFFIIPLFPILLLAAATNQGWANSLLNARPLTFLGKISYSLYMVHYICIIAAFDAVTGANVASAALKSRIVAFVAAIILSLVTATLVSRRIEYPARSFLRTRFTLARPQVVT